MTTTTISLRASDVSGQRAILAPDVPTDETVGQVVKRLLTKLRLLPNDSQGRPLHYRARLEREGRHLHGNERVGDALQPDDLVVLQPSVDAGLPGCLA